MKKFCPQFHLSLQSGCNKTLKRMNRHYTIEEYIEVCNNVKRIFPTACISTDIIVGFKGESEDEFAEFTVPVSESAKGVHTVWIVFDGRGMELDSFSFAKK